jgi:hypothetical protein
LALEVKPFSLEEGTQLFKQLLRWDSRNWVLPEHETAASELVKSVDGLALGLHLLAALIDSHGISISRFRDLYRRKPGRILEYDKALPGYGHTLDTVWRMSFEQLNPDTASLLGVISFLSPDAIPEDLFHQGTKQMEGEDEVSGKSRPRSPLPLRICGDEIL